MNRIVFGINPRTFVSQYVVPKVDQYWLLNVLPGGDNPVGSIQYDA